MDLLFCIRIRGDRVGRVSHGYLWNENLIDEILDFRIEFVEISTDYCHLYVKKKKKK